MPEIVADPRLPSSSPLLAGSGIQESQQLGPDPFLSRARCARALRARKLRQPVRPATRHPQSEATRARSRGPAAERAGAVESARPEASSVAALRRATIAAAACCDRPGRASRNRPVIVTHGRGFRAAVAYRSGGYCLRPDRARQRCAHRAAGACPAARDPAARTISAPAGASNTFAECRAAVTRHVSAEPI